MKYYKAQLAYKEQEDRQLKPERALIMAPDILEKSEISDYLEQSAYVEELISQSEGEFYLTIRRYKDQRVRFDSMLFGPDGKPVN